MNVPVYIVTGFLGAGKTKFYTGRLCVIGCKINQPAIRELFGI